ncbi:hypothetical protein IT575_04885 [bacterium]|nr:hypothetical protein [bacterium]
MASLSIVLCVAAALLAGCRDTLNVGGPLPAVDLIQITQFSVEPIGSPELQGGGQARFTVEFRSEFNPYEVSIDFGGCSSPNLENAPSDGSPFSTTVSLVDLESPQTFSATAIVTGRAGTASGPQTLTFTVQPTPNNPPSIDSMVVQDAVVTVTVSDPDGEDVTLGVDFVSGSIVSLTEDVLIAEGSGSADFFFSAADFFAGGSGTATFSATDARGGSDTATSGTISISFNPAPVDSLGAFPLATSASVDDTVLVLVAAGVLANPFQFMSGVSVVFPPGCEYVPGSLDFGAPPPGVSPLNPDFSADQTTVDGIWTTVAPTAGFLPVGDNLLPPDTELPAPHTGASAIDFNITPLGGQDAPAGTSGILFNFRLRFTQPGSYRLGFLLEDGYKRTYYEDSLGQDHQWGDISNSISQATVTVTP